MKQLVTVIFFVGCAAGIIVNTALGLHDGLNGWLGLGAFFSALEVLAP